MFSFSNAVLHCIKPRQFFNSFKLLRGLCGFGLLSLVVCVNPSPSGIYRYDATTFVPTSTTESQSSEESILPPPASSVNDCPVLYPDNSPKEWGRPVKWPASNSSSDPITSIPQCLDSNMQLKAKQCTKNSGWQPNNVTCDYVQDSYDSADKCPTGYELVINEICIRIQSPHAFNSEMCNVNLSPFIIFNLTNHELNALFTHLRSKSRDKLFWLPAMHVGSGNVSLRTGRSYSIDEMGLQWTLPAFSGERVIVHDNCSTCRFEYEGGCLALSPNLNTDNRFNTSIINCNANFLQSFCLFRKNETLRRFACPDGYVAPLMPVYGQTQCFAIRRFDSLPIAEVSNKLLHDHCSFRQAYQFNSVATTFNFELLAKQLNLSSQDRCLFGMTPSHVPVNSAAFHDSFFIHKPAVFVNWDASMGLRKFNVSSADILAVDDVGKWFWESNSVTCIVCSVRVSFRGPELELSYDSVREKLTLAILNADFLMPRFTNNLPFICFAKVNGEYLYNIGSHLLYSGRNVIYDIEMAGPGKYWCHGHAIQTGSRVRTDDVFANGIVMSMNVEFDCRSSECFNFDSLFREFLYSCRMNGRAIINPEHIRIENVSHLNTEYPANVRFANILYRVSVNVLNEQALFNEENVLNLSEEMLPSYFIRQKFVQISNLQNSNMNFRIRSVNSTNFCLPSSISTMNAINWPGARIGDRVRSVENCMDSNGRPLQRMCIGDAVNGALWFRLSLERQCFREESSDLTDDLQSLVDKFENPDQTEEVIERVRHIVTDASDRFVRMDVYFVSKIVGRATSFLGQRSFSSTDLKHLFVIYNNIMQVDHKVARSSAAFNSTNVLLESLDVTLIHEASALLSTRPTNIKGSQLVEVTSTSESLTFSEDPGIVMSTSPMLINIVIDPTLTDVSGVAILKRQSGLQFDSELTGFRGYSVQKLYRNQSSADLLLQSDLHVASFLPSKLLLDILTIKPDAKLVFSIFYNAVLFQTVDNETYIKSDGKIIAVSVPGVNKLPDSGWLPIYVKPENSINDYCGYWDFESTDGWSETGCFRTEQSPSTNVVLCVCNHLTHFAYLLKGNSSQFDEIHLRSLQGITVLGCTLSLIGIIGIYITAIQFRSWRSKNSTKYLLQLSTAIAFQMILLAFVNTSTTTQALLLTNNEAWCIVIGALLHYFVLAMFFWMLVIAYLQFIRYVIVFHHGKTPRLLLKSSLLGWSLPFIPVLSVIAIDRYTYVPDLEFSESQICYPSGYSLYFGVLLPIGVIVGANLVIFILVNYNLLRGTNAVCKSGDRTTKLSQLRLSIFLFFLLGLTWIFGLLSTAFTETSIVFSYLFCLTSTLQGFVMFLYFVILDPVARNLWIYFFRRLCFSKKGMIDIRKENSSKDSY